MKVSTSRRGLLFYERTQFELADQQMFHSVLAAMNTYLAWTGRPIGFFLMASTAASAINAKIIPVLRSTTSFFLVLGFLSSGVCTALGISGTSMECTSPGSL